MISTGSFDFQYSIYVSKQHNIITVTNVMEIEVKLRYKSVMKKLMRATVLPRSLLYLTYDYVKW
jgi:hypothetical protein